MASLLLLVASAAAQAADNLVLISFDGLRWQEVFRGLDRELAEHESYSAQSELLMEKFWAESPAERARKLLPFMHSTIFSQGSYVGNRDANSCARIANPWNFSYPGYSELLTGVVNEAINSNGKIANPERTVHELLEQKTEFQGRTGAFASWDVFPYIFNTERSGVHVNAFAPEHEPGNEFERLLNTLHEDIPTPWPTVRNDAFTHHYAKSWFSRAEPRLLYIAYGETDDFAHDGKYDEYILAAHRTDRFIQEIWGMIQSTPGYRDNTNLILVVDHGRGEDPIETWQHHASMRSLQGYMRSLAQYEQGIVGSENTWMAALGPDIADNGLIATGDDCLLNVGIAATVLELLGEDYRQHNPAMAAPIRQWLR
jgi:hypothetical protein